MRVRTDARNGGYTISIHYNIQIHITTHTQLHVHADARNDICVSYNIVVYYKYIIVLCDECTEVAYLVEVSASASLGNVVPVQVYVCIDASVYDVSKMYV